MKRLLHLAMIFIFLLPNISSRAETIYNLPDIESLPLYQDKALFEEAIQSLPEEAYLDNPYLILVNSNNPLDYQPYPELYTFDGATYFASDIYYPLEALFADALAAGYSLSVVSGHRTMDYQFNNRQAAYYSYINEGYSDADATYLVDLFYAQPDESEHLTGYAVDILSHAWLAYSGILHQNFQYEPEAIWLSENAHLYGFVLRYTPDKIEFTNIEFEPWHYRYVGYENAEFMYKYNLVLEEYLALIQYRDSQLNEAN